MAQICITSDLLETELTPQEVNTAMQFINRDLSIAYLQNSRVQIIRQLAAQVFDKPMDDEREHRLRASMLGKVEVLDTLIDGALNPIPVPVDASNSANNPPTSQL